MIKVFNKFMAIIFFPFSQVQKEIRDIHHHDQFISRTNTERMTQMIASLNGEDKWMLRRVNEKGECIDDV